MSCVYLKYCNLRPSCSFPWSNWSLHFNWPAVVYSMRETREGGSPKILANVLHSNTGISFWSKKYVNSILHLNTNWWIMEIFCLKREFIVLVSAWKRTFEFHIIYLFFFNTIVWPTESDISPNCTSFIFTKPTVYHDRDWSWTELRLTRRPLTRF